MDPASLYAAPNALAPHYSRFRVAERLLLTGHSHQAWPDEAFEAHADAWLDAARYVDDKWEHAFAQAQHVRDGFARLLGDAGGGIALAPNTHELVVRLLSALPLRAAAAGSSRPTASFTRSGASSIGSQKKDSRSYAWRNVRSTRSRRDSRAPSMIAPRSCWSRPCSSTPGASRGA